MQCAHTLCVSFIGVIINYAVCTYTVCVSFIGVQLHYHIHSTTACGAAQSFGRLHPPSRLNIAEWSARLEGYHYVRVVDLTQFGFPANYSANTLPQ